MCMVCNMTQLKNFELLLNEIDMITFPILLYQIEEYRVFVDNISRLENKGKKIVPAMLLSNKLMKPLLNYLFDNLIKTNDVMKSIKIIDDAFRGVVSASLLPDERNYENYLKPLNAKNKKILYYAILNK